MNIKMFLLLIVLAISLSARSEDNPNRYPDKNLPGNVPQVFAKNFISLKDENEFRLVFSADGSQIFYSVFNKKLAGYAIFETHQANGQWSKPSQMEGTRVGDLEPFISKDGTRFYFTSNRFPANSKQDSNIWMKQKSVDGWGKAKLLDLSSRAGSEWVASEVDSGNIYFARFDKMDSSDIFVYDVAKKQTISVKGINTKKSEYEPYIAPDESLMIFSSSRDGGYGQVDLYISFNHDGWSTPINMGNIINGEEGEYSPFISPDGKYLFYNKKSDLYWIRIDDEIKRLRALSLQK